MCVGESLGTWIYTAVVDFGTSNSKASLPVQMVTWVQMKVCCFIPIPHFCKHIIKTTGVHSLDGDVTIYGT